MTSPTEEEQKESPRAALNEPVRYFLKRVEVYALGNAWPFIAQSFISVLPPESRNEKVLASLANALMAGALQAWVVCAEMTDGTFRLSGCATTYLFNERFIGTKTLCLFTLFASERIPIVYWRSLAESLESYGRDNQASRMIAYTANEQAETLAKGLGFEVAQKILVKGL